ncbi:MAG: hypothetical protein ACYSW4_03605 [Planctomycetota bacterium]
MKKLIIPLIVLAVVMIATSIAKRVRKYKPAGAASSQSKAVSDDLYVEVSALGNLDYFYDHKLGMELAGNILDADLPYVNREDTPFEVDTDYFGRKRNDVNPDAGPFEVPGEGRLCLKVWPVVQKQTGSRRPAVVDQTALVMR